MQICEPNYTQIPNVILDGMKDFTDVQLRLLLFISRQTFGWHRKRARLSIAFMAKGTGLSEQGVRNAIKQLGAVIIREKSGDSFEYALAVREAEKRTMARVTGDSPTPSTVLTPSNDLTPPLNGIDPSPLNCVDHPPSTELTQIKKGQKKQPKEKIYAPREKAGDPVTMENSIHHNLIKDWCEAYRTQFGIEYDFHDWKDAKAVKELLGLLRKEPKEILSVAVEAWQRGFYPCSKAKTIHGLCAAWNEIKIELAKPEQKNGTKGTSNYRKARERFIGEHNSKAADEFDGVGKVF